MEHPGSLIDALEASCGSLADYWLEIRCVCERVGLIPLRTMNGTTRFGWVVQRLRCDGCKSRPIGVLLVDDASNHAVRQFGGRARFELQII